DDAKWVNGEWRSHGGWNRDFDVATRRGAEHTTVRYEAFTNRTLPIAPPSYFKSDVPDPEQMTYSELRDYTVKLRATGSEETPSVVALQTKLAFPLVTLIMTLIAVPFAVTTGRRGA